MNRRTRLWLGVGAAMLGILSLAPMAALAQIQAQIAEPAPKPGELSGDLAFARFIALIRGHLITGDELVKLHRWNIAYPHFTFPNEEIYGVIRDELHSYHTPPFDGALKVLARTVRARNATQYPKALEKVDAALVAADVGLRVRQPDWPRFTVAVAVEVLKTAADEYEDAVANGRIVHRVGYRTTRGFILQADRMIETAASELPASDAAALADIRAAIARIKLGFVSLNAPDRPAMDEKALDGIVSQVEQKFRKLAADRQI
jgi:hypothetical protein